MLDKDSFAIIRRTNTIRYVMKNGELFKGNTLKQLWSEQKAASNFRWQ